MIIIIDNGSQYTHLIKRNCRDLGFDGEIISNKKTMSEVKNLVKNAEKIILSGGPSSVYAENNGLAEEIIRKVSGIRFQASGAKASNLMPDTRLQIPILGICFGHQLLAHLLGGKVKKGASAEYGITRITVDERDLILDGMPDGFQAWASHFDEVETLPEDFIGLAHSETCGYEAMRHKTKPIFGVQFHPEVWHTENGERILKNFLNIK